MKKGEPSMDRRDYLTRDPEVCHGQLCAKGTRVLVINILDSLAEGATQKDVLLSYPSIEPEHVSAAIMYAAELDENLPHVRLR